MASNKKIDRAVNGPGLMEIIFGVIMSLTLGVLLGVLHLVFKPVEVLTKPSDDEIVGRVYFLEGSVNGTNARQWTRKRQMLTEGAALDMTFNEAELNAWASNAMPRAKTTSTNAVQGFFVPEKVNFRIRDDALQVGLIGRLDLFGIVHEMVFQARGKFEPGSSGYVFKADELYVGSLPVHKLPGGSALLIKRIIAAQEFPEDIAKTWANMKLVAVEGDLLRVVTP